MISHDTETLYRKVGRRYKPVAEYDVGKLDSLSHGYYVVIVQPGMTSYTRVEEPAAPQVLVAMKIAKEAMVKAMLDTWRSERPVSMHDVVDAGMKAMVDFDYSTAGLVVKDE
jgi:hypothetical protein